MMLYKFFSYRDSELDKKLDEIIKIADQKGLVCPRPEIRLVHKGTIWRDITRESRIVKSRILACAVEGKLILVFSNLLDLDEMTASYVIAHEFGHILDRQTGRKGHKILENIKHLTREEFADAIAAVVYSKLVVAMSARRLGPFDEAFLYRLRLD